MKKSAITFFVVLSFEALFLCSSAIGHAQSTAEVSSHRSAADSTRNNSDDSAIQVQFLGTQDDMVTFHVDYDNPEGKKFTLLVRDQDHYLLYSHVFSDKHLNKRFRLPKADKSRIEFTVRDARGQDLSRAFEINVNNRVVDEIAVKKLD